MHLEKNQAQQARNINAGNDQDRLDIDLQDSVYLLPAAPHIDGRCVPLFPKQKLRWTVP